MKRHLSLLLFLSLIQLLAKAQTSFNLKIVDLHSNTAVPFASLSMADHGQLVANVDGEITIMVKKLPVDIQISCIGYQSAKLTLQSNMQHIVCQLSPVEIVLEEIAMHTNPGLAILEAAYQKASSYHANKYYAKAFMRQLSAVNNSYEGIQETFFDATFTNYGITGWHPRQFRYSKSKQAIQFSNFNFLSFTTIGYLSSTVVNTPMLANIDAIYKVRLAGYIKIDSTEIAIINCQLQDNLTKVAKKMYFEGIYYINTQTFDVVKVKGFIRNVKLSAKGPVKLKVIDCPIEVIYTPSSAKAAYIVKFANLTLNGQISYAGIVKGSRFMYNSQLYIVQEDAALAAENFLETNHKLDDNKVLDEVQYDPVFWRNNELIKRTALENTLIKDFENKQLIGTYFQK